MEEIKLKASEPSPPPASQPPARAFVFPKASVFSGILVFVFAAVSGFASGVCVARGLDMPEPVRLVNYLGFPILLCLWLEGDARGGRAWCVWDLGFFVYLVWPVLIPYYLVKTRGARGLLPVLGFAGVYVAAVVVAFFLLRKG